MVSETTIEVGLTKGNILAVVEKDIVRAHGVPYATANRFKLPKEIPQWEGTLDCTNPACVCPQPVPSRLDFVTGPLAKGRRQREECLHVTVTLPLQGISASKTYPVLAFLHGGAYISGGSDLDCYEPSGLVRRGVIVVNISYRLGIFGYMPIDGIAPANLGLFDQLAALEWIQSNIGAFGGDASNVTLFGESAGADSIFCLMVADTYGKLFHRAILQSPPLGARNGNHSMLQALSKFASQRLPAGGRSRTTDEILAIQSELLIEAKKIKGASMIFAPAMGYPPLPSWSQVKERIRAKAKEIPILIGYTQHEGNAFVHMIDSLRWLFEVPLVGVYLKSFISWRLSTLRFHRPTNEFHANYLTAGGSSVLYKFRWSAAGNLLGSVHTIDLPFLLGTWPSWREAPMLQGAGSEEIMESLGREIKALWVAFACGKNLGSRVLILDQGYKCCL